MIFDTHAHYDDPMFEEDRETLLSSMAENGVGLILNPGCDVETTGKAIQMAETHDFMYAAAGIHPEQADGVGQAQLDEIEKALAHPKVKAVGEIGLDYYYEDVCPREQQKRVFRAQMELAKQYHLPVIIHDREAHEDCLSMVQEYPEVVGVFHCYSGSVEMAKVLLKMGWYLSFTGVLTFKNAKKAPDVVAVTPLDRLMVETDCPYMAPVPHRGKRNSSLYVHYVAEKMAEIKGLSPEEMIRITTENGKRFFHID
jgi:TatD DNase family protein